MARLRNQKAFTINRPRRKRSLLSKMLWTLGGIFLFLLFIFIVTIAYLYPRVPELNTALFDYSENAVIYDRYGEPYQNLQGEENRQVVTIDQVPDVVKNAFIAIEDKRFYSHHGVDIFGTGRAIMEVLLNRNLAGSGGSTITQQLIKQTHLNSEKTIERKFDEWILAVRLENIYSKDQILIAYLNKINFHGAEGIQAAAQQYFGKDASELGLTEAAILAAVPNSPIYFDPYTYNEETKEIITDENGQIVLNPNNQERALEVLSKMVDQGYISQELADASINEIQNNNGGIIFNNPNRVYSYFTDTVYSMALADLTEYLRLPQDEVVKFMNTSGLKIYSTVDKNVQAALESASLNDELFPEPSETALALTEMTGTTYRPEVGMSVINNADGSVVGVIGGRSNNASLTLNRATCSFQTGSCTKPLTTYAPALEEGKITLGSVYNDVPITMDGWQPQNSDGTFNGPTTVRDGLTHSVNTVAVQAFYDLGIDDSVAYAQKLGLNIEDADKNAAALALGGYVTGQSPIQMAAAFSVFPRGGRYIAPYVYTRIEDNNGNVLIEKGPVGTDVFSQDVSFMITDVLKAASNGGTTQISVPGTEIAGKTGTTDENVTAWFCGYSPTYTTSVWYGYDSNTVESNGQEYGLQIGVTGGSKVGPAGMFESVMNMLETGTTKKNFTFTPTRLTQIEIDKTSGKKPTQATELDPRGTQRFLEWYIRGTEPTESDNVHERIAFDTTTGYRAGSSCPRENVKQMGLINLSRIRFPSGITPVDSTYKPENISHFLIDGQICPEHNSE